MHVSFLPQLALVMAQDGHPGMHVSLLPQLALVMALDLLISSAWLLMAAHAFAPLLLLLPAGAAAAAGGGAPAAGPAQCCRFCSQPEGQQSTAGSLGFTVREESRTHS